MEVDRVIKTMRFPKYLMGEIESISAYKKINFTEFMTNAAQAYIREIKFSEAINESAGAWSASSHPELEKGTEDYIRKMRKGR
ncbi:hypothetical protein LLG07_02180 [bacterium]|nr:hypothetical protein [bacterium]